MKIKNVFLLISFFCLFPLLAQEQANESVYSYYPDHNKIPTYIEIKEFEPIVLDLRYFQHNPLFLHLIFSGTDIHIDWRENKINNLFYGQTPRTLNKPFDKLERDHPVDMLFSLRQDAILSIARTSPMLFRTTTNQLPQINREERRLVANEPTRIELLLLEETFTPVLSENRLAVQTRRVSNWNQRGHALLQFSQSTFSDNWHQGGNNFFSLLSVVSGHFNYDNLRRVRWNNDFEWRTGFNTVTGDPIRFVKAPGDTIITPGRRAMPNADIIRVQSRLGIRATGDFYYSTSVDASTHLFNNPQNVNSREMRARFLTPIRFNANIGMTYQVNRQVSVELSPLSYRFIHLTDTAMTANGMFINPRFFGIDPGENQLQEFGSRLTVRLRDYRPVEQLRINSVFDFFTNYERIVIDWEIVGELTINRFFSTRLMVNPRLDNTMRINQRNNPNLPADEPRARLLQYRQMLTIGFSYRFL